MAIRLTDTEDRCQIYQSRIVAKVVKCQQQAVFQNQLRVFPSPSCQRVEGFLFVQVSRQLPMKIQEIFLWQADNPKEFFRLVCGQLGIRGHGYPCFQRWGAILTLSRLFLCRIFRKDVYSKAVTRNEQFLVFWSSGYDPFPTVALSRFNGWFPSAAATCKNMDGLRIIGLNGRSLSRISAGYKRLFFNEGTRSTNSVILCHEI